MHRASFMVFNVLMVGVTQLFRDYPEAHQMKAKSLILAAALLSLTVGCDEAITEPRRFDGRLTITFDDGWESAYTRGLPTLRDNGLRGNIAVVTESVDYWDGFLTLTQLRALRDAGWSLVSHSVGHYDLTTLTDAELEWELTESKAWLQENGFQGSSVFVVPYHSFAGRELAAIRRHYSASRVANANFYSPVHFEDWEPANPYGLTSIEAGTLPFTTQAGRDALVAQVEAALTAGKFVDVMFHDIPVAEFDAFKATIEALAQFRSANATYHQLFGP